MWPGPLGRGVLGPRPAPSPFAGAALAGPSGGPLPGQVYPAPVPYQTAAGLGQQAQLGGVGQFGPSQPPTSVALQQPLGWFGGAPSQWDQASLAGSFNTTTLHQPATNDWYMDTGATAHMTSDTGLHIQRSSACDLAVYSDADWAGCPDTRRSTSGYA
uniref:Uncharacterized protein n=1 Tax=Oryza rufipogon TaxID=4529 RepID=A0A0E0PIN5_ORYRU